MSTSKALSCKTTSRKPMVTQKDRLLALLRKRYVTPLDALRECGCMSLAQRVSEWIADGLNIAKRPVDLPDGRRVMSYRWIV